MIKLRGDTIVLRTLEREHCRELWAAFEPAVPLPTEPLNPGLSIEGADTWFDEMQAKQGKEQLLRPAARGIPGRGSRVTQRRDRTGEH